LRAQLDLLSRINLMLAVQSCLQKYFRSRLTQIKSISLAVSFLMRGVSRSSRNAGRDAVDVAGALTNALTRTAKSCGPDASTPASSLWSNNSASDGDKKARSPGRARRKPLKPSRAGMPGDPGATVVTNARAYYQYTRGCGCNGHPAFPTPSFWGERYRHNSGTSRRENAESCLYQLFEN
jgi:hypothetical protein